MAGRDTSYFSEEAACRSFPSPRPTASLYDAAHRPAPPAALPEPGPAPCHRRNRPRFTLAIYTPPSPSRRPATRKFGGGEIRDGWRLVELRFGNPTKQFTGW